MDVIAQGLSTAATWCDALTGQEFITSSTSLMLTLAPYQVKWLVAEASNT